MSETICKNGHVMNIGFTYCQVCNAVAQSDSDPSDIEKESENKTANPNEIDNAPSDQTSDPTVDPNEDVVEE